MNNKLITVFNNRVPRSCLGLTNWTWRIPMANTNAEIVIPPDQSKSYVNTSEFDYYSAWEEITAIPDPKKPCGYRVELLPRPGFVQPERGFSLLFYNGTHNQIEGFTLSTGDRVSIPNH